MKIKFPKMMVLFFSIWIGSSFSADTEFDKCSKSLTSYRMSEAFPCILDLRLVPIFQGNKMIEQVWKRGIIGFLNAWQAYLGEKKEKIAVVNAANKELQDGRGVCGDIFEAAGKKELESALQGEKCEVGQVVSSDACSLKQYGVDTIIHAVAPDCRTEEKARWKEFLKKAYCNVFEEAKKKNIKHLVLPSLGTGIYACPKKESVVIALQVLQSFVTENFSSAYSLQHFTFVLSDDDLYNLFVNEADNLEVKGEKFYKPLKRVTGSEIKFGKNRYSETLQNEAKGYYFLNKCLSSFKLFSRNAFAYLQKIFSNKLGNFLLRMLS